MKKKIEKSGDTCGSCHGGAHKWVHAVFLILLGLSLYLEWLTLTGVFAIVFITLGLKHLFWRHKCC